MGIRNLSISDYPGKLCMSITVPGCNFRCSFCPHEDLIHHYIPMEKIPIPDIIETLYPRKGFLDGVCVQGGEPTLHRDLPEFLFHIKALGYLIKLDTNASKPKVLKHLIDKKLIDYVSVNIIAPFDDYPKVTRTRIKPDDMRNSVQMIRRSGVSHEFKVNLVPEIHSKDAMLKIAQSLSGSRTLRMTSFVPECSMDPEFREKKAYEPEELHEIRDAILPYFHEVILE